MYKSTEQLTKRSREDLEGAGGTDVVDTLGVTVATQGACEKIMSACRSVMHWKLLVDVILTLTVVVLLTVVEFGVLPHNQIGFFCNDPKISFKFTGDTISMGLLIVGSIVLPLIVMWICECICHNPDSYRTTTGCTGSRAKQIWSWYGHYAVGIVTLTFVCDVIKILIGEPRPHFFDTCRPRELHNCTDGYVHSFTCTNTDDAYWFVSDSSKSFPSGHSALSSFTAIFLMWYFQNRLPKRMSTFILKPWLQCIALSWGLVCSLTRIADNRHHWWDVLAGDILGVLFAIFAVKVLCEEFRLSEGGVSRAFSEPIENGHISFDDKRHQSVRKLLSNTSTDMTEGREMRDVTTT
ncbi:phospholipid phosphatase 1 isoform X2 [Cephus cinctus]|uniref:Phospholipid phosphatase 1 isoform X2 n=1 Tax=Cephus cinctus TaxID=211228 RepID=A0AAJ7FCF0_CEPCN|nr:phospholipid phosphatase 1 isoform X2 [Cephus cinctus]